ncbi:MAG: pyruvate kinase [Vicinamibacterales bacterium]
MRRTKIIATLGPSTSDPRVLDAIIAAGVDVVRLNFSHGTHADHAALFHRVREAASRAGRHVGVLQDLSGPKIRTGPLATNIPLVLNLGDPFVIAIGEEPGVPGRVSTTYAELARAVSKGDHLLLDDGRIDLEVESSTASEIRTQVVNGGILGSCKGINAPKVPLRSGLTVKDAADLAFGLALGVDLVALSFVQTADDVRRARGIAVEEGRPNVPIVAKLERPEAIDHLREILKVSDAVMVARGDLGIEVPLERVPRVQKEILKQARLRGVPVIVATQVLESMRTEERPTRAEVSDAAGSVDGGADAIMLAGETASGQYPVRTVEVLDAIIRDAESMPPPWALPLEESSAIAPSTALCDAAVTLSNRSGADAIVAITRAGWTARLLAARRPRAPIIAATESEEVARHLTLWHGVVPIVCPLDGETDAVVSRVIDETVARRVVSERALLVAVNTDPELGASGANFVRIRRL